MEELSHYPFVSITSYYDKVKRLTEDEDTIKKIHSS